jgi:hypothetical protein
LCTGHMQLSHSWLSGADGSVSQDASRPLRVWKLLEGDLIVTGKGSAGLKASCMLTVCALVREQLRILQDSADAAVTAALEPLRRALVAVSEHGRVSRDLRGECGALAGEVELEGKRSVANRRPLVQSALVAKVQKRLLNPKFEMDFDKRRDYDPDRERAEFKKFKRLAVKEQRGLILGQLSGSLHGGNVPHYHYSLLIHVSALCLACTHRCHLVS